MEEVKKNLIFSAGVIILGVYLAIQSFSYPENASFFPRVLSATILGLSGILLVRTIAARRRLLNSESVDSREKRETAFSPKSFARNPAVLVFGSITVYVFLIKAAGYLPASIILLLSLMFYLGHRKYVSMLLWAVAFSFLLYGIFFSLLGVPTPESLLWR